MNKKELKEIVVNAKEEFQTFINGKENAHRYVDNLLRLDDECLIDWLEATAYVYKKQLVNFDQLFQLKNITEQPSNVFNWMRFKLKAENNQADMFKSWIIEWQKKNPIDQPINK